MGEEMELNLWLFIGQNPSIIRDWIVFSAGIFFSITHFKRNPQKFRLTLFTFLTFLILSVVNISVFLGAFYSVLREGQNREIFRGISEVFSIMAWVALFFSLFSKEIKSPEGSDKLKQSK